MRRSVRSWFYGYSYRSVLLKRPRENGVRQTSSPDGNVSENVVRAAHAETGRGRRRVPGNFLPLGNRNITTRGARYATYYDGVMSFPR